MTGKQGAAEWLREKAQSIRRTERFGCKEFMAIEFGKSCDGRRCADCYADLFERIAGRIDAERALPYGMEWPRFEDGEPVGIGDDVSVGGEPWKVRCAILREECWALSVERDYDTATVRGDYGERVKRPAPDVLDADGVSIKVGDTVWATYNGCKHIVTAVCSDGSLHPEMATDDGCMVEYEEGLWDFAKKVTHEQPDSWEKLENDAARKTACGYAPAPRDEDGITTCDGCPFLKSESCSNEMMIDLVKRAKKLAKAGEVE